MTPVAATRPRRARFVAGIELPRVPDARRLAARRFRTLVGSFAHDLGGADALTEADRILIRQAVGLVLRAETLQEKIAAGESVDVDALVRVNSEARRAVSMLRKKAETSKPSAAQSLQDYLAANYSEPADASEADEPA